MPIKSKYLFVVSMDIDPDREALFNPLVYLISGFRWSFFSIADVNIEISVAVTLLFLVICMVIVWWFFKTGYRLKN